MWHAAVSGVTNSNTTERLNWRLTLVLVIWLATANWATVNIRSDSGHSLCLLLEHCCCNVKKLCLNLKMKYQVKISSNINSLFQWSRIEDGIRCATHLLRENTAGNRGGSRQSKESSWRFTGLALWRRGGRKGTRYAKGDSKKVLAMQIRIPGPQVACHTEIGLPSCASHAHSPALGKGGLQVNREVDTEPGAGPGGQ